jgi:hypothetical protein
LFVQLSILGSQGHCADHDLAAPIDENNEFEQVARSIRTDNEPSVWVLADVFDRQCVTACWMSRSSTPCRRAEE